MSPSLRFPTAKWVHSPTLRTAARNSAAAHGRSRCSTPSPLRLPRSASTYFFSPSKSKNDSKAGGAFILATRSASQTPTRSRRHPRGAPGARPLPGHAAAVAHRGRRLAARPLVDRMTFRGRAPARPREPASWAHASASESRAPLSPGRVSAPVPAPGRLGRLELARWAARSRNQSCARTVDCLCALLLQDPRLGRH